MTGDEPDLQCFAKYLRQRSQLLEGAQIRPDEKLGVSEAGVPADDEILAQVVSGVTDTHCSSESD